MTEAEYKSEFEHTKDTPYLGLTGELWGVFCKDFGENWLRYNSTGLYLEVITNPHVRLAGGIKILEWIS